MKLSPLILVLVVAVGVLVVLNNYFPKEQPQASQLNKFASVDELKAYLKQGQDYSVYSGMPLAAGRADTFAATTSGAEGAAPSAAQSAQKSYDYSTTNIQVAGVDESDFVKNDGKYIYTITSAGQENKVVIVDAYPADNAGIVSEIKFEDEGFAPRQLFLSRDRLVVFGSAYSGYGYLKRGAVETIAEPAIAGAAETAGSEAPAPAIETTESIAAPEIEVPESMPVIRGYETPKTIVYIYDISDRSNPALLRNMTLDGNYYNSRMIGDYVYIITNQPVYNYDNIIIPQPAYRCLGGQAGGCFNVYYFDAPDYNNQFTIVSAINTQNENEEISSKVFLMSYSQNLYVSQNNIYVTYSKRVSPSDFVERYVDAIMSELPADVQAKLNEVKASAVFSNSEKMSAFGRILNEYVATLEPQQRLDFQKRIEEKIRVVQEEIAKEMEKTIIQKISVNGKNIEHVASGEVLGNTLNQFSMDEDISTSNFRIATTTSNWMTTSKNHMYVLDSGLNIIGKLEDLASGERIYSVRFLGSRAYMVTFRQIDPLFVIELEPANNPRVLGFLKIPGVSDYLHPYDETHVIGVGRDATEEGRMLGLKLSLFDASDPVNPVEISKYIVGERGTYSEALNDHRAFLFSKEKSLLVIPVRLSGMERIVPVETGSEIMLRYYAPWQGAYVFNVDLQNGFVLKGNVTHVSGDERQVYDEAHYQRQIQRSLYMDDVLYTISQGMIKANSLLDVSEIKAVDLG